MIAFGLSIFLSAFLLFIVQPLMAKKLLPLFGGSPAVWLSIVVFFQSVLLLGYLYAFALTKLKHLSTQITIHSVLIIASILFLPIIPVESQALFNAWPPLGIFSILLSTLCLPAILISSSSPLLQYWYCQCYHTDFPYRFYSLSNTGSLLGLLAFPFLLEPFLGLKLQLYWWSGLYLLYLSSVCACLYIVHKKGSLQNAQTTATSALLNNGAMVAWIILTFLSSALLLTTTQVTLQNVAGFPLLWVLPLSLYLISFIITFAHPRWYIREIWIGLFAISCATVFYFPSHHKLTLAVQIALYASLLFSGCMVCHGELIRLKPDKSHLTTYYLMIALGGVLGGLFVNLVAPVIFNQWWDFYGTILGILLISGIYFFLSKGSFTSHLVLKGVWISAFIGIALLLCYHIKSINTDVILNHRNFFGSFEITERFAKYPMQHAYTLTNGNILHGKQFLHPYKRNNATSYYSHESGIGLAIEFERELLRNNPTSKPLSIGVIGLGAGTIASLAHKNETLRFYEIDPDIVRVAWDYFYYLRETAGNVNVVVGDGRIKLQDELKKNGSQKFDVLAIDAFNGDAIPVHLLTLEALQVYLSHLAPNGVLAFHISSRYVDLYPPLQSLASHLKLFTFTTHNSENYQEGIFSSQWVLMTRVSDMGAYLYLHHSLMFPAERVTPVWTDDYNYLLSVIRW